MPPARACPTVPTRDEAGLGLSIVLQLVERHKGSVRAESRGPGQGATLAVSLPMAMMRPERAMDATARRFELLPRFKGRRILIVDDDADARAIARRGRARRGRRSATSSARGVSVPRPSSAR